MRWGGGRAGEKAPGSGWIIAVLAAALLFEGFLRRQDGGASDRYRLLFGRVGEGYVGGRGRGGSTAPPLLRLSARLLYILWGGRRGLAARLGFEAGSAGFTFWSSFLRFFSDLIIVALIYRAGRNISASAAALIAAAFAPFLPMSVLDGAVWGQIDSAADPSAAA